MKAYLDSLSTDLKKKTLIYPCSRKYRFGDGNEVHAIETVKVPVLFGKVEASLSIDVVPADIPLLLSVQSLKKGKAKINFLDNTMTILNQTIPLRETKSGHLLLPLSDSLCVSDKSDIRRILMNSSVTTSDTESKNKALKLHRQFAHPPPERLKKLLRDSDITDKKLLKFIDQVSAECVTCQELKHPPNRPAVGFPLATEFNEVVAMDLKQLKKGIYILHMIDHATRYSSGCIIMNKRKETIVEGILKHWVKWFGSPKKFLSDNGGEFINDEVIDLAEKFNTVIKSTAAESPWSNGLCERHNALIASSIHRIRLDAGCSLEVALAWALSAKNCLANVHGFSPNQLVFGKNPNFPSVLDNKVPANNIECTSRVLELHLNTLHTARQAFIKAEASEKIKRALSRKTRSHSDKVYCTGDMVYYKRLNSERWHGPAKLLGKDGQICLLKHGGYYIRVHPCRMSPVHVNADQNPVNADQIVNQDDSCSVSPSSSSITKSSDLKSDADMSDTSDTESVDIDPDYNPENVAATSPPSTSVASSPSGPLNKVYGPASSSKDLPRIKDRIAYKTLEQDDWIIGKVVSRGGKVGGTRWHFLNVQSAETNDTNYVSFRDDVTQWREALDSDYPEPISNDDVHAESSEFVYIGKHAHSDKFTAAKQDELLKWQQMNVYSEVENKGQELISTTWVCTEKLKGESLVCKARLVARGFEEDSSELIKKSPTCTKDSFRLALSIIVSKGWKLQAIDIKSAFLQGEPLSRQVLLKPPKEAKTDKVWLLNQAVYGLCDAGRHWYDRVKNELLKLDVNVSKLDKAVFYYCKANECIGIMIVHVDDFLFGGTDFFLKNVISKLHELFVVGLVESSGMKYLGIDINQQENTIYMSMDEYIETVVPVELESSRCMEKECLLSTSENRDFRHLIGQINWCATQVRMDICFSNCQLSNASKPTIFDMLNANKVTKQLKSCSLSIVFSSLNCEGLALCVFTDASFGNLPSGGSQGAYVVFIVDKLGNANVLSWQSRKVRRICNSTLSAECLAAVDAVKAGVLLKHLVCEILCCNIIDMQLITDNKSLVQAINSVTPVEDKRLRIEIAMLQESMERKDFSAIHLIPSKNNMANALTKQGASCKTLINVLSGKMKYDHARNYFV